jgi:hypothetical protein
MISPDVTGYAARGLIEIGNPTVARGLGLT